MCANVDAVYPHIEPKLSYGKLRGHTTWLLLATKHRCNQMYSYILIIKSSNARSSVVMVPEHLQRLTCCGAIVLFGHCSDCLVQSSY